MTNVSRLPNKGSIELRRTAIEAQAEFVKAQALRDAAIVLLASESRMTVQQISRALGISQSTVQRVTKRRTGRARRRSA